MIRENQSIMLIDRQPKWLEFGRTTLSENGYSVYAMPTVEASKKLLHAAPEIDLDLILIDVGAFEDESALFADLTQPESRTQSPVVVLFPVDLSPSRIRRAFKQGVADCVAKPYSETDLLALVGQMLAECRLAKAKPTSFRTPPSHVLVVEDDRDWAATLVNHLPAEYHATTVRDYGDAVEQITKNTFDLAVIDLRLVDADDSNFEGMKLVPLIREKDRVRNSFTQIIVVSAFGTQEHIRTLYSRYSAYYYFDKRYLSTSKYRDSVRMALHSTALEHPPKR